MKKGSQYTEEPGILQLLHLPLHLTDMSRDSIFMRQHVIDLGSVSHIINVHVDESSLHRFYVLICASACMFIFSSSATSLAVQAKAAAIQKAVLKDGKDKGLSAKDLRQLRRNGPPIVRHSKSGKSEGEEGLGSASRNPESNHFSHHENIAASSSSGSGSGSGSREINGIARSGVKRKNPGEVEVEAALASTGMFHNDSRSSASITDIDRSMQKEDHPFNRTAASATKKQRQKM